MLKNIINIINYLKFLTIFLSTFSSALAGSVEIFKEDMVVVKFLYSTEKLIENKSLQVGLEFKLEPEWKIYWKNPGDAGLPPEINFSQSQNIYSYEVQWPLPTRIKETEDLISNVYLNKVVLPIKLIFKNLDEPIFLNGNLKFQVCKTICIPMETNFSVKISKEDNLKDNIFDVLQDALSNVPVKNIDVGITESDLNWVSENNFNLLIKSKYDLPKDEINIFIEKEKGDALKIYEIKSIKYLDNNRISIDFLADDEDLESYMENKKLIVYFSMGGINSFDSLNIKKKFTGNFLIIVIISLIAGFILNFMPCVLPVLSIKISRFISLKNSGQITSKYDFLATSLGIIVSFLILAITSIIIKTMGGSVGWGIHFQQPIFIALMLIIILLFSASLFGLFNLNLPSFIYSKIDKYLSTKVSSLAFFEGVFATLLATPCSAPFLGTAVGLALSSSSYLTLTIFILLGLGMSFPYLLFFIFPKFLNFLPKPGRWMNKLNIILGLSLIFSAIWLLKILLKLTNFNLIFFVLVITSILVFIFSDRKLYRSFFFILSLFIIILPIRFEETITANIINKFYKNDNLIWLEFDETKIDKYLDQNKIVFVDITADWCITCKVNDILVLDSKKVKNLFNSENVVLMRGDWTHEDKNISSFISNWQRFGIPLNVVYGPSVEKGILFPEILTKNLIEKNVLKAR